MSQVLPADKIQADDKNLELASRLGREDVQLFYQIALNGRRDLAFAPEPRLGFEMTMIRMLAFKPAGGNQEAIPLAGRDTANFSATTAPGTSSSAAASPAESAPDNEPEAQAIREVTAAVRETPVQATEWQKIIDEMALAGMLKEFAAHCSLKEHSETLVHLVLMPEQEHLLKTTQQQKLQDAIRTRFGESVKLKISVEHPSTETPAQARSREEMEKQQSAEQSIQNDPNIETLEKVFDARVDHDSIRPV